MVEIIALIFLCKKNGQLALQKGLPAGRWKLYTVLYWLVAELLGVLLGVSLFGIPPQSFTVGDLMGLSSIGLVSAFGGYLLVRARLENKPDMDIHDDIDTIDVNDLRPPPAE